MSVATVMMASFRPLYLFLQLVDLAVDGLRKCEKWDWQDVVESKETKTSSWFNRFIGRAKKPEMRWPFPFSEGKMFVLTIQAGVEGYHINVGGRHVASFPHRMVNFSSIAKEYIPL
jgi:hydroxyproline O-galactosyltransferase 2/3/4/5/6